MLFWLFICLIYQNSKESPRKKQVEAWTKAIEKENKVMQISAVHDTKCICDLKALNSSVRLPLGVIRVNTISNALLPYPGMITYFYS